MLELTFVDTSEHFYGISGFQRAWFENHGTVKSELRSTFSAILCSVTVYKVTH